MYSAATYQRGDSGRNSMPTIMMTANRIWNAMGKRQTRSLLVNDTP